METKKVCERNWPHTAGATAKRFSSTNLVIYWSVYFSDLCQYITVTGLSA
jgi:hypothetical protein